MFLLNKELRIKKAAAEELCKVKNELDEILTLIGNIEANYQHIDNNDLIESNIYELNSLRAKYKYLFKEAKELGELLKGTTIKTATKEKNTNEKEESGIIWDIIST